MKRSNRIRIRTKNLALASICASLSFVLLFLGTLSGLLDMSATVICGLIIILLLYETKTKYAIASGLVTFVFSAVFLSDKTICALYLMAALIYPLLLWQFVKIKSKILRFLAKILYAELTITVYVLLIKFFVPDDFTKRFIVLGYLLGTVCFILYDQLLLRFGIIYVARIKPLISSKIR